MRGGTETKARTLRISQRDDGAIEIVIPSQPTTATPADDLVPVAACGVEVKTVRALERRGLLRIARLGRRSYLKRSELLAAFEALAEEQSAQRAAKPANDAAAEYAAVVAIARAKRIGAR